MRRFHPEARTTPRTRAGIKASASPLTELAERYDITVATARKWTSRQTTEDRSHRPHQLSTTLTAGQEALVVELRRLLLLPLDDRRVVTREFINLAVSRSGLDCGLRRHGVGRLREWQAERAGETAAAPKSFKDYGPGWSMWASSTCRRCQASRPGTTGSWPSAGPRAGCTGAATPTRTKSPPPTSCAD